MPSFLIIYCIYQISAYLSLIISTVFVEKCCHYHRHSCASLLVSSGVPMKAVQEWLGHSDFSTTANIYSHLEYSHKIISADKLNETIELPVMIALP